MELSVKLEDVFKFLDLGSRKLNAEWVCLSMASAAVLHVILSLEAT